MKALRSMVFFALVACGDGRERSAADGGDPIVSCETTKLAWIGDCDPNAKLCKLDDGDAVWFDGAACR